MDRKKLVQDILKLKKEKNAVILAHCYQNIEVDEVADYVGDSLYLSQMAAETNADIIVFAGVYFMAETAKILSPNKKVLLPKIEAGCKMADMINLEQLREFKSNHPNIPVVCYINSTAEVKSESDICCTSSNAVKIVESLSEKEVLFIPDNYLGTWVQSQLDNVKVTTYSGFCPTHLNITKEDIERQKKFHPEALVLVHPECHQSVTEIADYVGSTTGIMKFAKESDKKTFIISTEIGVVQRLQRDLPEKEFILVSPKAVCKDMKRIHLKDIFNSLKNEEHEIIVDEKISKKALNCINRMLDISKRAPESFSTE